MSHHAVSRKLLLVFALQVAAISLAVIFGIFVTARFFEDSLLRRALEAEATLFAQRLAEDPDAPAPETVNMSAYLTGRDELELPTAFRELPPGLHKVIIEGQENLIYVQPFNDERIVLRFAEERLLQTVVYFALLPLALVLLVIYATAWIAYRLAKRSINPIVELAQRLEDMDVEHIDPTVFDPDHFAAPNLEVSALANALRERSERIQQMVERERAFTRDASHELRTPLTVVQMAAEVLLDDKSTDTFQQRNLKRIRSAAKEMQGMLEALLVLARNDAGRLPHKRFSVNDVVETELERCRYLAGNRSVALKLSEDANLSLYGIPSVLGIVISHLIRRVCSRVSQGAVEVKIGPGFVRICSETRSKSAAPVRMPGLGPTSPGETIIDRLSTLFRWPIEFEDGVDRDRVQAIIHFPEYELVTEKELASGQA